LKSKNGHKSHSKITLSNSNTKNSSNTKNRNILLKSIRLPSSNKKPNFSKQNSYRAAFDNKSKNNEKLHVDRNKSPKIKEEKILIHEGPFDLSLTSNKNVNIIKDSIEKALSLLKVNFKTTVYFWFIKEFSFKCISTNSLKFNVILCKIPYFQNLLFIKFQKITGSNTSYDEITQKILMNIKNVIC
jgi:hypothetical protein